MESYIAIHGFIKIIECRLLTICHGTNTGRGAVVREHNILVRSVSNDSLKCVIGYPLLEKVIVIVLRQKETH